LTHLPSPLPRRDRQKISTQHITFDDYEGKTINIVPPRTTWLGGNSLLTFIELDITELSEALAAGKLKGRLKEIVEASDPDIDNNVFVLMKLL
jgi:hypothetical protein